MAQHDFFEYKKRLLQLQKMNEMGTDQTDAADEIRDAMDEPGLRLSSLEHERVSGLAADLYMLTGEEVKEKCDLPDIEQEFLQSYRAKNWDRVLQILRKRNLRMEPHLVASTRAVCWLEFGDYDVSLLFAEHAVKLKPDDAHYHTIVEINRAKLNGVSARLDVSPPQQLVYATIHELSILQPA